MSEKLLTRKQKIVRRTLPLGITVGAITAGSVAATNGSHANVPKSPVTIEFGSGANNTEATRAIMELEGKDPNDTYQGDYTRTFNQITKAERSISGTDVVGAGEHITITVPSEKLLGQIAVDGAVTAQVEASQGNAGTH